MRQAALSPDGEMMSLLEREKVITKAFDMTLGVYMRAVREHETDPMTPFPIAQGKVLASIGPMFERLSLTRAYQADTANVLHAQEIARRTSAAYRDGYERGRSGQRVGDDDGIEMHQTQYDLAAGPILRRKDFSFAGIKSDWLEFNSAVEDAFRKGLADAKSDTERAWEQ
jgi:hypothetical protein